MRRFWFQHQSVSEVSKNAGKRFLVCFIDETKNACGDMVDLGMVGFDKIKHWVAQF
jgi:hypothetical protein